ncbi:hypothetical protein [Rhodothermus profundi]|uniref:Uncharacterized protein n=1 Tax=Rhodothermus profundi TaxID=633813 RepID=A0A1M6XB50_9BACT|nr:hypothetical protein [Rhodothermus profundi]SHL03176.1 hypothetical protein SAMN04488087_2574 [Rhodothermus profundi]
MKRVLLVLLGWWLSLLPAQAQDLVQVNILIRRPTAMPRSLDSWQRDPTLIQIQIRNGVTRPFANLRFSFVIRESSRGEILRSRDGHPAQPSFALGPFETRVFTWDQLIAEAAVQIARPFREEVLRDGIPEGDYEFCATILDFSVSPPEPVGSTGELCAVFQVVEPDPPELISPPDGETLTTDYPVFSWAFTPPSGITGVTYKLTLWPIYPGQTPVDASRFNRKLFETDLTTTTYRYGAGDPALRTDRLDPRAIGYVWQVQSLLEGRPYGRDQGRGRGVSQLATIWLPERAAAPETPLVVRTLTPTVLLTPASTRQPVRFQLENVSGTPLTVHRFRALWRTPAGDHSPEAPEGDPLPEGAVRLAPGELYTIQFNLRPPEDPGYFEDVVTRFGDGTSLTFPIVFTFFAEQDGRSFQSEADRPIQLTYRIRPANPLRAQLLTSFLRLTPDNPRQPVELRLENLGAQPLTITRFRTTWYPPGDRPPQSPEGEDGDPLPEGDVSLAPGATHTIRFYLNLSDSPFERLVRELGDGRSMSFQIAFLFFARRADGSLLEAPATPRLNVQLTLGEQLRILSVHPTHRDTLPWRPQLLIIRWLPFRNDYRGVTFNVTVEEEGTGRSWTNTRRLNWPRGPLAVTPGEDTYRASMHIVNVAGRPPELVEWANAFRPGRRYRWTVSATFRNPDGSTESVRSEPFTFVHGMVAPELGVPANNATFEEGEPIAFTWTPRLSPRALSPDVLAIARGEAAMFFEGTTTHQARLQVATAPDFAPESLVLEQPFEFAFTENDYADVLTEQSWRPDHRWTRGTYYWRVVWLDEEGRPYTSSPVRRFTIGEVAFAVQNYQPAAGAVINELSTPFYIRTTRPLDPARLRSGWLEIRRLTGDDEPIRDVFSNPERLVARLDITRLEPHPEEPNVFQIYTGTPPAPYLLTTTEPAQFVWVVTLHLNNEGVPDLPERAESTPTRFRLREPSAACLAACEEPLPANRTLSTEPASAFVGRQVQIGKFLLRITEATGTGSSLSGRGIIQVTLGTTFNLRVRFENLQINTEDQVVAGEAFAETDDAVPDEWATRFERFEPDTARARRIREAIRAGRKLVSLLGLSTEPVTLPIGLDQVIEGSQWVVAIVGVRFLPTRASFNALLDVPMPFLETGRLALGARDVCINPRGLAGAFRLALERSLQFTLRRSPELILRVLGEADTEPGETGTGAGWDCTGFQELQLALQFEFPREWFIPINEAGTDRGDRARATFRFATRSLDGWLVSGTMDRARITGTDFIFEASDIVYDNATHRNPPDIVFPEGYEGSRDNSWTGWYIRNATFFLPSQFGSFEDPSARLSFGVQNVLIDGTGLTLVAQATNLLNLDSNPGSLDGWAFSIERIRAEWVSSSFREGQMQGQIRIPIGEPALQYTALLQSADAFEAERREGERETEETERRGETGDQPSLYYSFRIEPPETFRATLFEAAQLQLQPTSRIEITNRPLENCFGSTRRAEFQAYACLNGTLTLAGDLGGIPLSFRGVQFENFGVSSRPPYFASGTWSWASPPHYLGGTGPAPTGTPAQESMGFPVTVEDLGLEVGSRDGDPAAGLRFALAVHLGSEEASLSARTTLTVWGRLERPPGAPMRPAFAGVELNALCLGGSISGVVSVSDDSCLEFYRDDPTYGSGFAGTLNASFLESVSVSATARFGEVDGFNYWYIDGLVTLGGTSGIPIGTTGMSFYGFGGGIYYRMRQANLPDPQALSRGIRTVRYVPDRNVALGLRAATVIGTSGRPEPFNADVTLEVAFNRRGGLNRITLRGDAYMLVSATDRPSNPPITGNVSIDMNFAQRTFDATFQARVLLRAGGVTAVDGSGEVQLHFAPRGWFLRVGRPTPEADRMRLQVIALNRVDGYLWIGNWPEVPSMPDPRPPAPPIERTDFTGELTGRAFLFGASTGFEFSGQFLIFYGELNAFIGFDLALIDYGPDALCTLEDGRTMTGIGINGWYAQGQLYAGITARLSIEVDLFLVSGRFDIFNAAVGATLGGGLPNPTYATGAISGRYSILGGAIKGTFRYDFNVGDVCKPLPPSPLEGIELITDLRPRDGERDVDVFTEPMAAFSADLDRPFVMKDAEGREHIYRLRTSGIVLRKDNERGPMVRGRNEVTPEGDGVYFQPDEPLESFAWYWAQVNVYAEELIGGRVVDRRWVGDEIIYEVAGGRWEPVRNAQGELIQETRTVRFQAGARPEQIRPEHVLYSYPRNRQRYFLQDMCDPGRIYLAENYQYLAENADILVRFTPVEGGGAPITVEGQLTRNAITFPIPELLPATSYVLQVIRREHLRPSPGGFVATYTAQSGPAESPGAGGTSTELSVQLNPEVAGQFQRTQLQRTTEQALQLAIAWQQLRGALAQQRIRTLPRPRVRPGEQQLYLYYFRTSRYRTLQEKFAQLSTTSTYQFERGRLFGSPVEIHDFQVTVTWADEGFERYDFERRRLQGRLWREALLTYSINWQDDWMRRFARPYIYEPLNILRRLGISAVSFYNMAPRMALELIRRQSLLESPLQDSELMPPPPVEERVARAGTKKGSLAWYSGQMQMRIPPPPPPQLVFQYRFPTLAYLDHRIVQNQVAALASTDRWWSLSDEDRRRLWLAGFSSFVRPYSRLSIWFGYPTCAAPDLEMPGVDLSFETGNRPPRNFR